MRISTILRRVGSTIGSLTVRQVVGDYTLGVVRAMLSGERGYGGVQSSDLENTMYAPSMFEHLKHCGPASQFAMPKRSDDRGRLALVPLVNLRAGMLPPEWVKAAYTEYDNRRASEVVSDRGRLLWECLQSAMRRYRASLDRPLGFFQFNAPIRFRRDVNAVRQVRAVNSAGDRIAEFDIAYTASDNPDLWASGTIPSVKRIKAADPDPLADLPGGKRGKRAAEADRKGRPDRLESWEFKHQQVPHGVPGTIAMVGRQWVSDPVPLGATLHDVPQQVWEVMRAVARKRAIRAYSGGFVKGKTRWGNTKDRRAGKASAGGAGSLKANPAFFDDGHAMRKAWTNGFADVLLDEAALRLGELLDKWAKDGRPERFVWKRKNAAGHRESAVWNGCWDGLVWWALSKAYTGNKVLHYYYNGTKWCEVVAHTDGVLWQEVTREVSTNLGRTTRINDRAERSWSEQDREYVRELLGLGTRREPSDPVLVVLDKERAARIMAMLDKVAPMFTDVQLGKARTFAANKVTNQHDRDELQKAILRKCGVKEVMRDYIKAQAIIREAADEAIA